MSRNKSKEKGTKAERALANVLPKLGWPLADRGVQRGRFDRGDIMNTPGVCFEAKDAVTWDGPEWMRQTEVERINAKADFGVLVIKTPGVGYANAHRWLSVMDGDAATGLMHLASPAIVGREGWDPVAPQQWVVPLPTMSFENAWKRLAAEEKRHPDLPVVVNLKKTMSVKEKVPGFYSLMRLDVRCSLLVDAGYGTREIMG